MGHNPEGEYILDFLSHKNPLCWVSELFREDKIWLVPFSSRMEPFKSAGYFIKVNFHNDRSGYGERYERP